MDILEPQKGLSERHSRAFEEAFALQLTEQIISSIERLKLKTVPKNYDTARVRASIQNLKEAVAAGDDDASMLAEFRLKQELQLWRIALAGRDSRISAEQLRRFCEENSAPLSVQVLAALGRFYRNQTTSPEIRSKFDFIVTRIFAVGDRNNRRALRCNRAELTAHLADLNHEWTGLEHAPSDEQTQMRRQEAVATFEVLIEEIQTYEQLEKLLKSEFFNRLRRLKQYLGDDFYAPEVSAASIECNIAVGNKFAELLEKGTNSLQESLQSEFGSVEMWNATLIENPKRMMQLLNRIAPEEFALVDENNQDIAADSDFTQTFEFDLEKRAVSENKSSRVNGLQIVQKETAGNFANARTEKTSTVNVAPSAEKPQNLAPAPEFSIVSAELARQNPNEKILRDYLAVSPSPEMQSLDFNAFLMASPQIHESVTDDSLRRQALNLIFGAENYLRKNSESFDKKQVPEINAHIEEMQKIGNGLRLAISSVMGENKNERTDQLLFVTNILLKSRLRLTSLLARNNALEEGKDLPQIDSKNRQASRDASETRDGKSAANKTRKATDDKKDAKTASRLPNQWLVAATVLVVCIGIIAFVGFPYRDPSEQAVSLNVKVVETQKLTGGEVLMSAKVNSQLLIGVVSEEWKTLDDEKKQERLKSLLEQGAEHNFKSVLLMNTRGEVIATASDKQIVTKIG